MSEAQYISYFENLAKQSIAIGHDPDQGRYSFFYIEDPYNMEEIDLAIRNRLTLPALLLETSDGELDKNATTNYTDTIKCVFSVIGKANTTEELRQSRDQCKRIGIEILARMSHDSSRNAIVPGKNVYFRIEEVEYSPISVDTLFFGYQFSFRFVCPFGFSVDSAIWHDK
ncbi:hypothetical protein BDE36_1767 [Arcticibacter tournemirensis]|uniref:Uncharacterized protein n=1 Tax=Arcticibacter tournemirensis TaxID=699437 RepID=A0A5M9HA02_9SPHI|nr:hypothetical protein [Arcticibacter tournemirensis]KAA8483766.1 hypothetical protein F1649_07715 [Arcticibacter tournemirensis]TQM50032.1 hypothetical protein BDE36_1767 [Arcticibacter tournemirensis]